MKEVKNESKVKVDYTGKFSNGEVFDSSIKEGNSQPIEVQMGQKQVIPGFENALLGMKEGEEKDVIIKSEEGYGERKEELIQEIPKEHIPDIEKIKEGMTLALQAPTGQQVPVVVKEIKEKVVVMDLNHPLAGKELHFHLKVVSIE